MVSMRLTLPLHPNYRKWIPWWLADQAVELWTLKISCFQIHILPLYLVRFKPLICIKMKPSGKGLGKRQAFFWNSGQLPQTFLSWMTKKHSCRLDLRIVIGQLQSEYAIYRNLCVSLKPIRCPTSYASAERVTTFCRVNASYSQEKMLGIVVWESGFMYL
jgi:hypothetical protein